MSFLETLLLFLLAGLFIYCLIPPSSEKRILYENDNPAIKIACSEISRNPIKIIANQTKILTVNFINIDNFLA